MDTGKAQYQEHLRVARFAALAIVIHILESGFPSPVPGIKPGLANVITLIVLLRYSWNMAVWVTALRVLVGSMLIGSFLTPGFLLSASGAACSLLALALGIAANKILSPVNLCVFRSAIFQCCKEYRHRY